MTNTNKLQNSTGEIMQIQATYYATEIAISVIDFDPTDSMHSMLKNMLEQKGFKSEENPNTWVRRSFKSWDNYQFWQTEVDKLVNHFKTQSEEVGSRKSEVRNPILPRDELRLPTSLRSHQT
ncbi:MAG: hypothetical protein HWQ38_19015 [Nostoc sp. NMS7]|uniref:hypothetical protein n=1 Tax=Nostoc sp. NMS7 TaxID=2815391 RepID=UPI0025FF85E0|nr:hypothetical protein [Nostoc sp. NMS7]MBN3948428.1 hypothetical protein [Nostoc sp. NMS7]